MKHIVEILTDEGEVIDELDEFKGCWGSGVGCFSECCGGCDRCLLAQYAHCGAKMRYKADGA
jgi:hypothetical protein